MNGRQYRLTTKEEELPQAKQFAEDWYVILRGKARAGLLKKREKTLGDAADAFTAEYEIITEGQRSPKWVQGHQIRLRLHLIPFFGPLGVSEVTPDKAQEYRVFRITGKKLGEQEAPADYKAPSRSTIHDEIVTLRLVLKTAVRKGWLSHVPDLSPPYKTSGKIEHRPWFSKEEYKQLYKATGAYARTSKGKPYQWAAEQVHDYVLLMGNTGLRPDEAMPGNLEHRDIKVVRDQATGEQILEIEVRGKRGTGFCKSMPGAVGPYRRLLARAKPSTAEERKEAEKNGAEIELRYPEPTDPVFPGNHIKLFNGILRREKLKFDREGKRRTAYSLRHSYICMRLSEGADIYQLAKNCRTSVEMIQKFYAAHIKDIVDTAAINVMRPRPSRSQEPLPKPANRRRPRGSTQLNRRRTTGPEGPPSKPRKSVA